MCEELQVALSLVDKELGSVNRVPCLAHVIQLALKKLVEHIKIKPRNSKVITEWYDDEKDREKHSDASRHDGVPWTLKLVRFQHKFVIIFALINTSGTRFSNLCQC
jgi:hypothetical protein